ncbi:L-fucose:H+ symporter permease [Solirubrobacter soli]|uniref:L-fucose:H+ symporter permease n=1 Tax=Solirubrobacter soli TaxID=363832 RepID=UPI00069EFC00|nr:L-fucose:H+ symporter permease [Solirubrobacter soli]
MSSIAKDSVKEAESTKSEPLVGKGMLVLFIALISCFTAWGVAQDLTTPMVAGFKRIFDMSTLQASLVQLAYFGAYFLLALPAAFINQRFGYKAGILTGLALAALGAFLFYPASKIMTYEAFLVALFAMAAGCSILETSANPYVMSLGSPATATRRLNLAQAFNPVGTNIGVLLASALILPKLSDPVDVSSLTPAQLHTIRAGELGAVMGPYLGLAFVLSLIAVAIASQKAPKIIEEFPDTGTHAGGTGKLFGVLWSRKRYRYGVVAQFFNVAAQVCTWTYLIQYVEQALGGSLEKGGAFLQASLLVFLFSRFLMTWVIGRVRATIVLAMLAFLAVGLCVFAMASPNLAGVLAVVGLSFCLSLMFPTIYGVALEGLGPATKFGAAGLVMAIVGGAIMPLVQGALVDATSAAISFIVPAFCFAVVGLYALYDLRTDPNVSGGVPVPVPRPAAPAPVGGAA